ncbi:MAG: glycosyltransferase [Methylococcales bacterium]
MNILFIISSLRPGGAERQLVELIKGLDKSIYNIYLIVNEVNIDGYQQILDDCNVTIHCFRRKSKYDLSPVFKTIELTKKLKINVIHTFLNLGSIIGILVSMNTNIPIICSALRTAKDENWKFWLCSRIISARSDYLVSNSLVGFKNRFKKMRPKFRVVYNGVDFSRFRPSDKIQKEIVNELSLAQWEIKIGMVATLSEKKDHKTLLDAAKIVLFSYPQTVFIIVGEGLGARMEQLQDYAVKLDIDSNVIFTGFRSDVDQLIQLLDIIVLLTNKLYGEGSPNAVIEGMAVGKPIIATKGGGTDEVVIDHVNGLLVEPEDAQETAEKILFLINNQEASCKLANYAKKFVVDNYSLDRYVTEHETMYHNLITDS